MVSKEKIQVNKAQDILKKISPSLIGVGVIVAEVFINLNLLVNTVNGSVG